MARDLRIEQMSVVADPWNLKLKAAKLTGIPFFLQSVGWNLDGKRWTTEENKDKLKNQRVFQHTSGRYILLTRAGKGFPSGSMSEGVLMFWKSWKVLTSRQPEPS